MASLISARIGGAAPAPAAAAAPGAVPPVPGPAPVVAVPANPPRAAAAATAAKYPELGTLIVGFVLLAGAWALAVFLMPEVLKAVRPTAPIFTPPDGISAFALFFLAATVVERIIEPFSSGLVRATPQTDASGTKTAAAATGPGAVLGKSKAEALEMRSGLLAGIVAGSSDDPESDAKQAASEQATADQAAVNAGFIVWAVATVIAVPIVAYFGLSLPAGLGVTKTNPTVDLLITALVIGAGTKPLHDFFSNVEKSSASKDDAESTK